MQKMAKHSVSLGKHEPWSSSELVLSLGKVVLLVYLYLVELDQHKYLDDDSQFCCCLVFKSCLTLHDPMDQSTPDPPVFHCLPELGQIHVGRFDDTVQPSHPLSSPSPLAFTLSQHQSLFQRVFSSHEMAKVLQPQLQDLPFQ